MKKYLYLIKKAKIKSWLKFWLMTNKQFTIVLSEILEGFSFNLQNTVKRYFKIFNIFGNSVQNGTPTPTNPVPIESVADDVNLFDIGTINDYKNYEDRADRVNWLTIENNKMICVVQNYGETLAYNNNFYFKPNTTYSFSLVSSSNETRFLIKLRNLQDTDWLTDSDTSIAGWTYNSYYKGWFVTNAQQKTINIPNCLFGVLGFGFNSTTETTGTTQTISNIKIQKGTTATPYSPYNQGTVTIKQRGKNLFDLKSYLTNRGVTYTENSDGSITFSTAINLYSNTFTFSSSNTNVSLSGIITNSTATNGRIQLLNSSNVVVGEITSSKINYENLNANQLRFNYSTSGTITLKNIQLEEGSTSTLYEPYQTPHDYTFQTEPLRSLPNGVRDSLEDDGIHRRVGRVVYDGTEDWYKRTDYYFENHTVFRNNSNRIHFIGNGYGLSNYFEVKQTQSEDNQIRLSSALTYGAQITTANNIASTPQELKTWLSTHNLEVLYELEEEIIEPYTEEQQEQYNKIKELYTFDGTTNISSDDEVPPYLQIQYYMKGE